MPSSKEGTDEELPSQPIDGWPGVRRRPILHALGAGAALALGSSGAAAHADGPAESDQDESEEAEIDPRYGFPAPDAEDIPQNLEPDHEVELHTVLPEDFENPDHPPFFHFEPSGIHVESNDIVQFTLKAPDHTITAYHPAFGFQQRVPDKVPPFSSPVMNVDGAWLYEFVEEGVYDLYCGPHHVLGMNMRIVVGELADEDIPDYEDTFEGSQDPPLLAPFSKAFLEHELNATNEANENCEWSWLTPQEVLDAPSLDPSTIQDQGSVSFESVLGDIDRFPDELPEHDGATPTVQVREHDEHGNILVGPDEMTLYIFDQDRQADESGTVTVEEDDDGDTVTVEEDDDGDTVTVEEDDDGDTVTVEEKGLKSNCYDDCAEAWPPLTVDGEPTAGDDVTADLTTFERETGEMQVAANGWPLYYFAQDEEPGDANGQGVNDVWWVLQSDGTPVRSESTE